MWWELFMVYLKEDEYEFHLEYKIYWW